MVNICVVDDNPDDIKILVDCLNKYAAECSKEIQITCFESPIEFLENNVCNFDIMLLDIEMPGINGIETAKEIRQKDQNVGIIFVTNMAQYAINGYEVNASDFILKPIQYKSFIQKFEKALEWSRKRQSHSILLNSTDGIHRIESSDIFAIIKEKNYLIFNTELGDFKERGTISDAIAILSKASCLDSFGQISAGAFVNLAYVTTITKDSVTINDKILPVSRRMHKDFIQTYINWGY